MNSFQKLGSTLALTAALTACSKPNQTDTESTQSKSPAVVHQTQKNVRDTVSVTIPKTIEIAGHTILAVPLEQLALDPEQQKQFEAAGGLINPSPKAAMAEKNQNKMMQWDQSFETLKVKIDGTPYEGFDLFKKVYEDFPGIQSMTKEQAIAAGIYPIIHYRNFSAYKWVAKLNGLHIANTDEVEEIFRSTYRQLYPKCRSEYMYDPEYKDLCSPEERFDPPNVSFVPYEKRGTGVHYHDIGLAPLGRIIAGEIEGLGNDGYLDRGYRSKSGAPIFLLGGCGDEEDKRSECEPDLLRGDFESFSSILIFDK